MQTNENPRKAPGWLPQKPASTPPMWLTPYAQPGSTTRQPVRTAPNTNRAGAINPATRPAPNPYFPRNSEQPNAQGLMRPQQYGFLTTQPSAPNPYSFSSWRAPAAPLMTPNEFIAAGTAHNALVKQQTAAARAQYDKERAWFRADEAKTNRIMNTARDLTTIPDPGTSTGGYSDQGYYPWTDYGGGGGYGGGSQPIYDWYQAMLTWRR